MLTVGSGHIHKIRRQRQIGLHRELQRGAIGQSRCWTHRPVGETQIPIARTGGHRVVLVDRQQRPVCNWD